MGVIIGRTGASVLQQLLPWVSDSFTSEEKDAMMESLRAATRNTMFDRWVRGGSPGRTLNPKPLKPPTRVTPCVTGGGRNPKKKTRGKK